jgi:transcriptional/translational regulatory protein YebC/TACO1
VRVITDNKNRVAANIRHHFSHNGGNLGESGSVASFVFQHKGVITIAHTGSIEQLENDIIESGADDYKIEGEKVLVMTPRTELAHIGALLKNKGHSIEEMKLEYIPASTITIEDFDKAVKIYKLLHDLNEDEDVEDVWSNAHLTAEHMERAAKAIENAFVRK